MSYELCLELAGAKILAFKEFGSYQGDWWAKVEYNGQVGWVSGSYGSCSGCDAFEAEFGFVGHYVDDNYHSYFNLNDSCPECKRLKNTLVVFGEGYLDGILSQEEAEKEASEYIDWDLDARNALKFLKENSI